MFCMTIRIKLKGLGFIHMPEICFHPPNVWHEFWDRIENVGFYTHPRSMFPSQQMFSTNIRRELKMLGFMHILEIFSTPKCFAQISG